MKTKSVQSGKPAKSPSSPGPRSRRTPSARGPLDREPTEIKLLREFAETDPTVSTPDGYRCLHFRCSNVLYERRQSFKHIQTCPWVRARKFLAAWDRKTAGGRVPRDPIATAEKFPVRVQKLQRKPRKRLAWDT